MKRIIAVLVIGLALLVGIPVASAELSADQYIADGEMALFTELTDSASQAYNVFSAAKGAYPDHPVINAYLAFTRILDLGLKTAPGGLRELLSRYGIAVVGENRESLYLDLPEDGDGEIALPESSPTGEEVRSFLAGPFITAVQSSIENLDTTINNWVGDHIIPSTRAGTVADVEFDLGEIYLLRSQLKWMKAVALIISAYDLDVDVREIVSLMNFGAFHPGVFLDRYSSFLNLLASQSLGAAKTAMLEAISDYMEASQRIRNDTTQTGAEEMFSFDPEDLPDEQLFRDNLAKIHTSLQGGSLAADLILEPAPYEEHLVLNLNPLFNNTPDLRDMLPQFNECGEEIADTMGHGMADDPTLGGILPNMTQAEWELEGAATCGPVGPVTSVTGTISIPNYDNTGAVYVGVFRDTGGTLNTSPENRIGGTIIYPGSFSQNMTYTITGLPVGEKVLVTVRWDADYDGLKDRGDYIGSSGPYTLGASPTTVNLEAKTLYSVDGNSPYFRFCTVLSSGGTDTIYAANVFDPNGSVPNSIASLTVTGPGNVNFTFTAADCAGDTFSHRVPGVSPQVGEYVFTVTDNEGKTAVSRCYFGGGTTIPAPVRDTMQASGANPLTPTLSWGGVPGYQGDLFYRVRIFDATGNTVLWNSAATCETAITLPSGVLSTGTVYKWQVQASNQDMTYADQVSSSDKVPLTIDDATPFFRWAAVSERIDSDGTRSFQFEVAVSDPDGTLPASIQSLNVYDPAGNYVCSLTDYLAGPKIYYKQYLVVEGQSAALAPGVYRFVVTDTENLSKESYDSMKHSDIPVVDSATLQASGNPLEPTFSWGAPAGMNGPIYYRVIVRETVTTVPIWSSGRTPNTSLKMPSGVLQQGTSYQWQVRAADSSYVGHYNVESRSQFKDLSVDNVKPFFEFAAVYKRIDSSGVYTQINARVRDPNGTLPGSITSCAVTGPNGFNVNLLGTYRADINQFSKIVSGPPLPGEYTFTMTDSDENTVVTRDWVGDSANIPMVDQATIQVSGHPLVPTISWGAVAGYAGDLFYRVLVQEPSGNIVHMGAMDSRTTQSVPNGKLWPGKVYLVMVETSDHKDFPLYNARSNSNWGAWSTEDATGISGRVTDSSGVALANVPVYAHANDCRGQWMGSTTTDKNGNWVLGLPAGTYIVRAYPTGSNMPYVDEWYGGAYNCNDADRITLSDGQFTWGNDFALERAGEIKGFVHEASGVTPIAGLHVFASNYATNEWVGGANTDTGGLYTIKAPAGGYRVRACASCNDMNYVDEFYDNKMDYNSATGVTVFVGLETAGIDFGLDSLRKRPSETEAVDDGLAWLAQQQKSDYSWGEPKQNPDGSWSHHPLAKTALAAFAFGKHAVDSKTTPFADTYSYRTQVVTALNYVFAHAFSVGIGSQPAGNPDTNNNGIGIYFEDVWDTDHGRATYYTAIAAMAIAQANAPDEVVNVPGSPVHGRTYRQVLQDVVDYIAWGQTDSGVGRGGWSYVHTNMNNTRSDQSNAGWMTLALAYAEAAGATIPGFVRTELEVWINAIQDPMDGDTHDGGSHYEGLNDGWGSNVLRTGNLLQQMAFVGDTASKPRVQNALAYMANNWSEFNGNPLCFQSAYTTMKGLEAIGLTNIGTTNPFDWFADLSDAVRSQQTAAGWWPLGCYDDDGILSNEWAIMTLQKAVAPTEENPDLKVSSIQVTEGTAGTYTVAFTLENGGNLPATANIGINLSVDGNVQSYTYQADLAAGATTNVSLPNPVTLTGWADDITVCVDVNGQVPELNEDNNCSVIHWPPRLLGDVNGNRTVDLGDVILALKVLVGLPLNTNLDADVDEDAKIGLAEAIYVLQYLSQLRD